MSDLPCALSHLMCLLPKPFVPLVSLRTNVAKPREILQVSVEGRFPGVPQLVLLWVDDMGLQWQPRDDNPWNWDREDGIDSFLLHRKSSRSFSYSPLIAPFLNGSKVEIYWEDEATNFIGRGDDELEENIRMLTHHLGLMPSDLEWSVNLVIEVFTLLEGSGMAQSAKSQMWCHSVRTGYMAALISVSQGVDQRIVWQAFVGGLLHDIGILIHLAQQPQAFMGIVERAQTHGLDLGTIEKRVFGTTHAKSGSQFLVRWGIDQDLLTVVEFHDEPFQIPYSAFGPLTAVYIANILEGGGIAQDGDGVIGSEGEAYVRSFGLWDALPLWQGWMRKIHHGLVQSA